jgi:hypothetical protein
MRDEETWVKKNRTEADDLAIFKKNRCAYFIMHIIATRARRTHEGLNPYNLEIGEAMLGNDALLAKAGMTEQEYRGAKKFLEEHGIATFRKTNKFTAGKLVDTRFFDPNYETDNEQNNYRATTEQRPNNEQTTPNKNVKKDKKDKNVKKGDATVSQDATNLLESWYSLQQQFDGYVKRDGGDPKLASRILASGIPAEDFLTVAKEAREALKQKPEIGGDFWVQRALSLKSMFESYEAVKSGLAAFKYSPEKKQGKPCML